MNTIKTFGNGLYFRMRRLKKAFRNWKKFGVVIFGSMFLASSLVPGLALAQTPDTRLYEVYLTPQASNSITVGQSKDYHAQAFLGLDDVTAQSTFTWVVSQGNATVTTAANSGKDFVFTPTAAGTYTIKARGFYTPDTSKNAWQKFDGTLVVTDGGTGGDDTDTRLYEVYLTPQASNPVCLSAANHSKDYHAQAFLGLDDVTAQSTFTWVVSKDNQTVQTVLNSGKDFVFTPTSIGTYTIKAQGTYTPNNTKMAWQKFQGVLVVNNDCTTPPPTGVCAVQSNSTIQAVNNPSNQLTLVNGEATQAIKAQFKTSVGNVLNDDYNIHFTTSPIATSSITSTQGDASFRATAEGTYTVTAIARHENNDCPDIILTLTLTVLGQPTGNILHHVKIVPQFDSIQNGQSSDLYTAYAYLDQAETQDVSNQTTFVWKFNPSVRSNQGNAFTSTIGTLTNFSGRNTTFIAFPNAVNSTQTFFDYLYVEGTFNNVTKTDYTDIQISPLGVQDNFLQRVTANANPTQVCFNSTSTLTAQAFNNNGGTVAANYAWTKLSGHGHLNSTSGSNVTYTSGNDQETATFLVIATSTDGARTASNTTSVSVVNCNNQQTFNLNGNIFGVIEDGSTPSPCDVIVYTVTITNPNATTVHNVQVRMPIPANTEFVSATSAVSAPALQGNEIAWNVGTMTGGQTRTMVVRARILCSLNHNVSIIAHANVTGNEISPFTITSNRIDVVFGGTRPTPPVTGKGPLASTGMDAGTVAGISALSMVLSILAYAWLNRRKAYEIQ